MIVEIAPNVVLHLKFNYASQEHQLGRRNLGVAKEKDEFEGVKLPEEPDAGDGLDHAGRWTDGN